MAKSKFMPGQIWFQVLAVASDVREFVGNDGIKRSIQSYDFFGGTLKQINPTDIYPAGSYLRLSGLVNVKAGTLVRLVPSVFELVDNPDQSEFARGPIWGSNTYGVKDVYTKDNKDFLSVKLKGLGGLCEIRNVNPQIFRLIDDQKLQNYSGSVLSLSRYDNSQNEFELVYVLSLESVQ